MDFIDAKTIVISGQTSNYYLQFEYVMKIYRDCNHGCIYCYARSNYCEKTDNFANLMAKKDALRIDRDDLLKKKKRGVILTGGVSDSYHEKRFGNEGYGYFIVYKRTFSFNC